MRRYKILWSGAALLGLVAIFLLSGAVHAKPMTLKDLLIGRTTVSGHGRGGDVATSGQTEGPVGTGEAIAKANPSVGMLSPEVKPSTKTCVFGRSLLAEFRKKVLAAEKRVLVPGWVYNYTEEDYFLVAGKRLADGRPVPTHQVGEVWFLWGDYSPTKGALVTKMYSISKTNDPDLTYWAYETSDASYDLSLGIVTPLDEPPMVRLYPKALDMILRGTLDACGGIQVGRWQGKKVYVFTKQEQYESPFTVGKGGSALKLFGSGYRLYYDFATGLPVGSEDFRLDADGKEILARRVVTRWERKAPSQVIVQRFQQRLQEVKR